MSENAESTPAATAQVWKADHTALVHELWAARHEGLTLDDADTLARFLRRSRYQWAVQERCAAGEPPMEFRDEPGEHTYLTGPERDAVAATRAAQVAARQDAAAQIAESFGDASAVAAGAIARYQAWLDRRRLG